MIETSSPKFDVLTVIGMAAVAYVVTTLLHEGLGHGGACLAVGGQPQTWGAYYFDCDTRGLPAWTARIVAAAGSTVNAIVAVVTGLMLSGRKDLRGAGALFLWLMFALNAFTWAGYYLFSGVANVGDWSEEGVLNGLSFALPLRIAMAVVGGILYFLLGRAAGQFMSHLVGNKTAGRRMAWTAYITGGVVALLIGLMNPVGIVIVIASSLASSLGGTSGLLWQHTFIRSEPTHFALPRSWPWIAAGVIAAGAYAAVLGRSLTF